VKLHHTSGSPDWASIAPEARTSLQRIAAATQGIVTLPNFLSVGGFVLVCGGLLYISGDKLLAGVVAIAAGRLCDLLDGGVAERTGTKSPVGEAVDAGCDKLGALATLVVLGAEGIVPWWAVGLIGAQNVANGIIGIVGWQRHTHLHPVRAGKLSTALEWAAFLCFILAAGWSALWDWPAYTFLGMALGLGIYATAIYSRGLRLNRPLL
jgi:phosphatidylglycerophosphate synthase